MQNVLIVGNVTKDVYLRYDNRKNNFETDQNGTQWLDLAFNGSAYKYYSRASIFGGAAISLEIFSRFGFNTTISNTPATFLDGQFIAKEIDITYRYILCQDDNVAYLTPSEKSRTTWKIPDHNPDWIYVDRSAILSPQVAEEILGFVNLSQSTRLALFIGEHSNQYANHMRALIERADMIITDIPFDQKARDIIRIGEDYIEFHNKRVPWTLENRQDIVTRLSSHLTIAATLLAARALGKPSSEALLLARANVQTSNLGANDEYVYDEVVKGVLGEKGSTGLLVLDFGYASAGDVIEIYGVIIEETECPEPPTYYLVGSMTEWAALDEYRFTESAEVAGEFTLETQLEAGMLLKVVGISEGEETWYPAGFQDGYEVDAAHAGLKTVYFRPAGNEDWAAFGGYIYIDATQAVSNVNAAANTNRYLRDGQVFIQIDGKTYNVLGQKIAQ